MWDWRRQGKLAVLTGHQSPVASVDMSVDGTQMASGDRDGFIFIWDTVTHTPKQVITAHEGAVLCCSLSPCGTMVATTGADGEAAVGYRTEYLRPWLNDYKALLLGRLAFVRALSTDVCLPLPSLQSTSSSSTPSRGSPSPTWTTPWTERASPSSSRSTERGCR